MSEQSQGQAEDHTKDDQPPEDDGAKRYPARPPQQPPGGAPPKRKPRWGFIILGIVVVVGAVLGVLWWLAHRNELTTDDAFTDGRAITLAPRVSGNVIALDVNDNQYVKAGQRMIQIDPRDYIAARDQAAGDLRAVQAQLANAQVNLQLQQVTQPARLAQAHARFHAIDPAATTRQDIDAATATERQAAAEVAQAQAQVNQASTVGLNIDQAQAQIRQLEGQVAQSQAKLDQANLNLSYTAVTAPQDGWVARRNVEQGNYVEVGATIFSIVTPEVWVTANYKEDELKRMRPGQHVRIHVDAYPQLKLEGHVDSVQLGSGSKFSAFPAENATGNFVKIVQRVPVKIVIDRGLDPNLPLPLGISVEPTVDLR
jgi:membrane fusion protein (multidrug efflux system)